VVHSGSIHLFSWLPFILTHAFFRHLVTIGTREVSLSSFRIGPAALAKPGCSSSEQTAAVANGRCAHAHLTRQIAAEEKESRLWPRSRTKKKRKQTRAGGGRGPLALGAGAARRLLLFCFCPGDDQQTLG